jgi:cellulose synthase/poly-beta-1,6-N-acetylglucosamine synthase-like glycosyltransferase
MTAFYILASLVVIQGIIALWDGIRYWMFVRRSLAGPPSDHAPKAAVIAPVKGVDPGFRDNVRSLLGQDYPDYEVIFVTESKSDPAHGQIHSMLQEESFPWAILVDAGRASGCGQKVHNVLAALDHVSDDVEALAFVDMDVRPPTPWLRSLIAPLADADVGATTGYRWYVPASGNFCSLLRSLWNASTATMLGPHKRNFAWGGSMAIRRETLESLKLPELWAGACSDDFVLSRAVKARGLHVQFVPRCLVPSVGACSLGELLQFTRRQMLLTRVYSLGMWFLGLATHLLFAGAFYGGLGIVVYRQWLRMGVGAPEILLGGIYLLGVVKSGLRQRAVERILGDFRRDLRRHRLSYWLLYPLGNLVFVYSFLASAVGRRIKWRGIRYKLVSPSETLILGHD